MKLEFSYINYAFRYIYINILYLNCKHYITCMVLEAYAYNFVFV